MTRSLTRLLDFDDQYRRDSQQSQAFLHRRDRRFAQQQQTQRRPLTVSAWLAELHALNDQRQPHNHDPRLRRWRQARWIFAALGAVLGAVFMAGLLVYDGSRQINVTLLLLLIALQLGLALITSLQAWLGWQPWDSLLGQRQGEDPLAALRPALCARIAWQEPLPPEQHRDFLMALLRDAERRPGGWIGPFPAPRVAPDIQST